MIENNSIVSKFLSSFDEMYSSLKIDNESDFSDSENTINEESLFISTNKSEMINLNNSIFNSNCKDSEELNDDISKLFFNFRKYSDDK